MDVTELSKDQLSELKYTFYYDTDTKDILPDYITCPEDIPDDIICDHYSGIDFVDDDFFCTCNS